LPALSLLLVGRTYLEHAKKLAPLVLLLPLVAFEALAATVSPSSLSLIPGQAATVAVTSIQGTLQLTNSNSQVASATLSGAKIKVTAMKAGSATLSVKDRKGTKTVKVTGQARHDGESPIPVARRRGNGHPDRH
jgi:hypothetical protein